MINKRGRIAIFQIMILVIGIVAFAGLVEGAMPGEEDWDDTEGGSIDEKWDNDLGRYVPVEEDNGGPGALSFIPGSISWIKSKIAHETTKSIVGGFATAAAVYGITNWVFGMVGADKEQAQAISMATTAGSLARSGALLFSKGSVKEGTGLGAEWLLGISQATWIGVGVTVVMLAWQLKDKKYKTVVFECKAWDADTGGSNCEECNKNGILPCSEYQCRALGQGCELVEDKCVWRNEKDKDYPVISLNSNSLLDGYKYVGKTKTGVEIKRDDEGCVKAFTPLTFGVNTNEIATCKLDYERKDNFEEMRFSLGRRDYNHTVFLSPPTPNMTDIPEIQNGEDYKFYMRCQDTNGNENPVAFAFKFCVEQGPDMEDPTIVATSIPESSPYVGYETIEVNNFRIGVNEPAYCKWDTQDKSYDDMINVMSCGEEEVEMNLQMLFECSTKLTGIEKGDNNFYFRCRDRSVNENKNTESYEFILKRTQEKLKIDTESLLPTGIVRDSTKLVKVELKVKTLLGAEEGKALCYYGEDDDYEGGLFFETSSHEHMQELHLEEGHYTYHIKCVDAGGDSDTATVSFDVESDEGAPKVVRVFKKGNNLEIATSENADCVYNTAKDLKCDYEFKDGLAMTSSDSLKHSVPWDTSSNYYIKCKDEYNNQPSGCSIIVKPSEF